MNVEQGTNLRLLAFLEVVALQTGKSVLCIFVVSGDGVPDVLADAFANPILFVLYIGPSRTNIRPGKTHRAP